MDGIARRADIGFGNAGGFDGVDDRGHGPGIGRRGFAWRFGLAADARRDLGHVRLDRHTALAGHRDHRKRALFGITAGARRAGGQRSDHSASQDRDKRTEHGHLQEGDRRIARCAGALFAANLDQTMMHQGGLGRDVTLLSVGGVSIARRRRAAGIGLVRAPE